MHFITSVLFTELKAILANKIALKLLERIILIAEET